MIAYFEGHFGSGLMVATPLARGFQGLPTSKPRRQWQITGALGVYRYAFKIYKRTCCA